MTALKAAIKRKQQRAASQAAASSKLAQAEADLAGVLESLEAAAAEGSVMQQQQAKMQEMHAMVVKELDKGDSEAGGPEPGVHAAALFPVQVRDGVWLTDPAVDVTDSVPQQSPMSSEGLHLQLVCRTQDVKPAVYCLELCSGRRNTQLAVHTCVHAHRQHGCPTEAATTPAAAAAAAVPSVAHRHCQACSLKP
jgi:hypothetical protein